MNCTQHPEHSAIHQCAACNRPLCSDCGEPKLTTSHDLFTGWYRRHRFGEGARWAGGSSTILYCKPDCDPWLAVVAHNALVAKLRNALWVFMGALLLSVPVAIVAVWLFTGAPS